MPPIEEEEKTFVNPANDCCPSIKDHVSTHLVSTKGKGKSRQVENDAEEKIGKPSMKTLKNPSVEETKTKTEGIELDSPSVYGNLESSGVTFHPHKKYWRIAGKYYDLTKFMDKHPGGRQLIEMARDRFDDCTFAFEAHHHDYKRARAFLRPYFVRNVDPSERQMDANGNVYPTKLSDDKAFYSVLRQRVTKHFKSLGDGAPGPTTECVMLFWTIFFTWVSSFAYMYYAGTIGSALLCGLFAAWLGAFGHNWVHQPKYRFWATLSLDTVGFSSEAWYREHILQHHMYTNTPLDNHFKGTDPFLVCDPTVKRNFVQAYITPLVNPLLLTFGVWANYTAHTICLLKGEEPLHYGKFIVPLQIYFVCQRWGLLWGLALFYIMFGFLGIYYFTLALMNHNAEHCTKVPTRNKANDWGIAQLHSSADWGVDLSFFQAIIYLWLNYHTVHHLFPHVDMSRHMAIQKILTETCEEFGVSYVTGEPVDIWIQMVNSFGSPGSLFETISCYSGAI
eukprot:g4301.t1